jgi:hypothetical protein
MNQRSCGNIPQGKSIARLDIGRWARDHPISHVNFGGGQDVSLLTVRIVEQGDPCRSIGIIFDGSHFRGNLSLVPFEVDDSILPFMTSPSMPSRDPSVTVPSSSLVQWKKEAFLWLRGRDLLKG